MVYLSVNGIHLLAKSTGSNWFSRFSTVRGPGIMVKCGENECSELATDRVAGNRSLSTEINTVKPFSTAYICTFTTRNRYTIIILVSPELFFGWLSW